MSKSLDEVYRRIEAERQFRIQQQYNEERRIIELREQQRQEWLRREKMFEYSFNVPPSSSSSAGSGGIVRQSNVYEYTTSDNMIFLYQDNGELNCIVYDFTNNVLNGPTVIGIHPSVYDIYPIQRSGFFINVSIPETEGSMSFIITPLAEVVFSMPNIYDIYIIGAGGIIVEYIENDIKKILFYRNEKIKISSLGSVDSNISIMDSNDEYAKNGIYYVISGSSYSLYYLDDEMDNPILLEEDYSYFNVYQHKNLDICLVFYYDSDENYILKVYERGVLLHSLGLSEIDITSFTSVIFLNSNGDFIVYGNNDFEKFILHYIYGSGFSDNRYDSSYSIYDDQSRSYLSSYSSETSMESYLIVMAKEASVSNGMVTSDSSIIVNYFVKDIAPCEYIYATGIGVNYYFISSEGKVSHITNTNNEYGLST